MEPKSKIVIDGMEFDCEMVTLPKVEYHYDCAIPKRKHSIQNVNRVAVLATKINNTKDQKRLKKLRWQCIKAIYQRQKGGK